jgi:hypothetical protein
MSKFVRFVSSIPRPIWYFITAFVAVVCVIVWG